MIHIYRKSGFEMLLKALETGALCVLAGKALLDALCMTGVVDCDCCGCCDGDCDGCDVQEAPVTEAE
ncbi:MAG: hypothetical protein NC311_15700 [Muribaculaceae bacterium]|nr:hypothetical protein [Muribaculaceae bacterium]